MRITPYLSRMSGIRVSPNSAVAASESCSGIRHRLMSRCERSLVGRGASIRGELSGTTLPSGAPAPPSSPNTGYSAMCDSGSGTAYGCIGPRCGNSYGQTAPGVRAAAPRLGSDPVSYTLISS